MRPWVWGAVAFLVAAALAALVSWIVYNYDSMVAARLSATTLAVVTNVNPTGYIYRYNNNACIGDGTRKSPPPLGTQVRIVYDPSHPCDNLDYDPLARRGSDLKWLIGGSTLFSLAVGSAVWDATRRG